MARRRVLPRGAGGVRCGACGAHAAADGKGSPIILIHDPDCPDGRIFKREILEDQIREEIERSTDHLGRLRLEEAVEALANLFERKESELRAIPEPVEKEESDG